MFPLECVFISVLVVWIGISCLLVVLWFVAAFNKFFLLIGRICLVCTNIVFNGKYFCFIGGLLVFFFHCL